MNYQQVLETIKDRIDIVDLVSERVSLKRRGRNFVGLCPFHAEKTPSFTVSPEKQMFYCFGCGAGGDAITFWMKIENLDFNDAVKDLADRLGIELPKKAPRGSSKWETYHAINRAVKDYFRDVLLENQRGKAALAYLKKRGLSQETIRAFELGFAPGNYGLSEYLEKKGYDPRDATALGLLKKVNEGTFVPVFRNRIIFPIIDERGRTVGFGGRALGDAQPKYLNTPDSMIFQKGKLFYGEVQTKREIARERKAVLVEGYLDLISLYQLGIKNGIAALGTAFTDFHAKRLKRWADQVVMLFDGDAAGYRASSRALEKLIRAGLLAYQGALPEGKDPGDYLAPPDAEALKEVIATAEDAVLFRVRRSVETEGEEKDIKDREERVKEGLGFLRLIRDPVRLDLYVKEACEILGLKKEILYDIIKNSERKYNSAHYDYPNRSGETPRNGGAWARKGIQRPYLPGKQIEDAEEVLLISLMQCPELSHEMKKENVLGMFRNATLRSLGKNLLSEIETRGAVDASRLTHQLEAEEQALLSRLLISTHQMREDQVRKAFSDGLRTLYQRNYKEEISKIKAEIQEAEKKGDSERRNALLERLKAAIEKKKNYQNPIQHHKSR